MASALAAQRQVTPKTPASPRNFNRPRLLHFPLRNSNVHMLFDHQNSMIIFSAWLVEAALNVL